MTTDHTGSVTLAQMDLTQLGQTEATRHKTWGPRTPPAGLMELVPGTPADQSLPTETRWNITFALASKAGKIATFGRIVGPFRRSLRKSASTCTATARANGEVRPVA